MRRQRLDWSILQHEGHAGLQRWVRDLNHFYRDERAASELDFDAAGFQWLDADDAWNSVLSFVRRSRMDPNTGTCEELLIICNFTPLVRENYRVGVPHVGYWRELLNSDARIYGGSSVGNLGGAHSVPVPFHGRPHSLNLTLPPLAMIVLKFQPDGGA